ncbi:putative lipid II flippase FtsW [Propionivibrio sp.]|uniref:putative lipid II flippase FtsW n=1 Tax=Propionivibrio sp. TaxID=2212460 RepID=UPI0025E3D0B9|nr:putative lipid II flippase FtsW [Propionivibrio sp.]MBK7354565.1 putative lipid II flippase FtsW [Propionivibrio sp.]MBK8401935.1 putative lipid II flippase FtsW [Propionivibrio sp.]MBK8743749.1 putative lipid II flippase FtsW [Propionivibrio sp.]MBK8895514.1 putative lipid II flippase FtsW [Propionivibrio sp.]MBL0206727.1 putative lipid II flippase FtsW [Propionivibrio sp.]
MLSTLDTPRRMPAEVDLTLLWSAMILLLTGMVMVYSASIAIAEAGHFSGNHPTYFLVRHGVFLGIGLIAAAFVFQVPLSTWQQLAPWLFVAGFVLLALVLIPGVGRDVNGARRWLSFGIVNLQPSELMKLFAVLYAADYTVRKMPYMHDLKKAFLPLAGAMVGVGFFLLKEPDFGAFVVIISIAIGILFLGGMRARLFAILIVVLVAAFAVLIIVSPYRRDRIFGFMDPWADALGRGYQLSHALIAFGRGEWLGVGLGASVEKLFYLPEAHTDFLLAVIAEELGFAGVVMVIVLFALVIQRAFVIGRQAVALERLYPALVAQGIGIWIGIQSFINMGVNTGLLPTKGLTLPLMSFGGSGILANCAALAILLRVDWENRQLMRGAKV